MISSAPRGHGIQEEDIAVTNEIMGRKEGMGRQNWGFLYGTVTLPRLVVSRVFL